MGLLPTLIVAVAVAVGAALWRRVGDDPERRRRRGCVAGAAALALVLLVWFAVMVVFVGPSLRGM